MPDTSARPASHSSHRPQSTAPDQPFITANNAAAVADVVAAYCRAEKEANAGTLDAMVHPVWCAKRAGAEQSVEVESREAFISRLRRRGPRDGELPHLSTLHLCFSDFAIARIEEWSNPSASFLLLFKESGAWRIAGEASASGACGSRDPSFRARSEEAAVLGVLEAYYRAVTEGDAETIRAIFAACWHMKNHQEDVVASADTPVVSEGKDAFVARIAPGPLPGYWDDRQIADVQIVANRLAFVRVDKPSTPSTTVFLFMKLVGGWKIIDKAWTDGRKAA